MTVKYLILTEEIHKELNALAEIVAHIATGLVDHEKADEDDKGYIVDSLALSLQSFYTGCENIFRRIATYVDGELPAGERWHADLLEQMSIALPETRPPVITENTKQELKEFLSFRHTIRNIYIFDIASEPVMTLASTTSSFFQKFRTELAAFCAFLNEVGKAT
jgi:hypothetical protein